MVIKFKSKHAERESLIEPLEIELWIDGKEEIYFIQKITPIQFDAMMDFQRELETDRLAAEKRIRDAGGDVGAELEKARQDYKSRMLTTGVPESEIDVSGVSLASPSMTQMAKFVAAILCEDVDLLCNISIGELNDVSEFLFSHIGRFLNYKTEEPEVKNSSAGEAKSQ